MSSATYALPLRAVPDPEPASRFNAYLLNVTFEGVAGERLSAFGGGESVAAAIAAARDELPAEGHWSVARWNYLYGE